MADHTTREAEKLLEVRVRPLMGNLRLREGEELAGSHRVAELGLESGSLIPREWMRWSSWVRRCLGPLHTPPQPCLHLVPSLWPIRDLPLQVLG